MADTNSSGKVVAGVPDVFFASKIGETARHVGVKVEFANSQDVLLEKAAQAPSMVILDLNARGLDPIPLIRHLKADPALAATPVVSFVNHECTDLIEGAKAAGCDEVLTRGAFSSGLPEILRRSLAKA